MLLLSIAIQEGTALTGNSQNKSSGQVTSKVDTAVGRSSETEREAAAKDEQTQQTAALEATIAELQARLQQAEEKSNATIQVSRPDKPLMLL